MNEIGGDLGASLQQSGLPGLLSMIDRLITQAGHHSGWLRSLQLRGMLSAAGLLLGLVGGVLILILPPLIRWALRRAGHLATNFRGERIVQSYGLVILCWTGMMFAVTAYLFPGERDRAMTWLCEGVGFGFLGLLDDCRGNGKVKGLRGHFRALLRDHVITTGLIKALGGCIVSAWLVLRAGAASPGTELVSVAVIALSANAVNLLDLRPGRACAAFLAFAAPLIGLECISGRGGVAPLLLVAIPALRVYRADAGGVAMLGDTGSNLLGGALGLAVVEDCTPLARGLVLIGLIALQLLAERRSLTAIIAGNRILNAVDRLTGVR